VIIHRSAGDGTEALLFGVVANELTCVLVSHEQMRLFLAVHASCIFVCYDAARVHWTLHRLVTSNGEAADVERLWALSRESRLHDVMLLDQEIRCFDGCSAPEVRALDQLASHYADLNIDPLDDIERDCGAYKSIVDLPQEILRKVAALPNAVLRIRNEMQAPIEGIYEVVRTTNPPVVLPMPSLEYRQQMAEQHPEIFRHWGEVEEAVSKNDDAEHIAMRVARNPLGIGIAVQAVIVRSRPARPGPEIEPPIRTHIREWCESAYSKTSRDLHRDLKARKSFRWRDGVIQRDDHGQPIKNERIIGWLRDVMHRLCDAERFDELVPTDSPDRPSSDPEKWGALAASDRALRAWRDLLRIARLARWAADSSLEIGSHLCLKEWEWAPNVLTVRSLTDTSLRPREGCAYLVLTVRDLKLRCMVGVVKVRGYMHKSHFSYHFKSPTNATLSIAAALYAAVRKSRIRAFQSLKGVTSGAVSEVSRVEREYPTPSKTLKSLRHEHNAIYRKWVRLCRALLETQPLGLEIAAQHFLLKQEFRIDALGAGDFQKLGRYIVSAVDELAGFMENTTQDDISSRLERPFNEIIPLLPPQEHVDTYDDRLRNDLGFESFNNKLVELLKEQEANQRPIPWPKGKNLRERWLSRSGVTLSGRVTTPACCRQTRRREYEAAIDEVRIRIAYELCAAGYELVASYESRFVVEIQINHASIDAHRSRIKEIAENAAFTLLGGLAPQCRTCGWDEIEK
jgi:hypothetical protein